MCGPQGWEGRMELGWSPTQLLDHLWPINCPSPPHPRTHWRLRRCPQGPGHSRLTEILVPFLVYPPVNSLIFLTVQYCMKNKGFLVLICSAIFVVTYQEEFLCLTLSTMWLEATLFQAKPSSSWQDLVFSSSSLKLTFKNGQMDSFPWQGWRT